MTTFSPSDAALEGFRVLRRDWRTVAGWGGFNLLALVAMVVLTVVISVPIVVVTHSTSNAVVATISGLIWLVGYLLVKVVVVAGLYRLMLRRDEPSFLHLRLGPPELRILAVALLFGLAFFALTTAVVTATRSLGASPAVSIGLTTILLIVVVVISLRLGLTPVISFAEGGLPFAQAWRRSRGVTWRLIGMTVLLYCLLALIGVVLWIALFATGGFMTGFGDGGLQGAESFAAHPGRYLFQIVAEMVLEPVFIVLLQAPWVAVYRAVTPEAEPAAAFA